MARCFPARTAELLRRGNDVMLRQRRGTMSLLCSACETSTSVNLFMPRYAGHQSRQWVIHPDESNDAYCKLVEYLAFIMQHNLLFHRLPFWSDQGGSKI